MVIETESAQILNSRTEDDIVVGEGSIRVTHLRVIAIEGSGKYDWSKEKKEGAV